MLLQQFYRIFALSLLVLGCSEAPEVVDNSDQSLIPVVSVVRPIADDGAETLDVVGSIKWKREIALSFEQAGAVNGVYVDEGDTVKAGQLIADIRTDSLRANERRAAANLERAQREVQRFRVLFEKGYVTARQFTGLESDLEVAKAEHSAARINLNKTRILSPSSGVVLSRQVEPGMVVQPGQAIASVADQRSPLVLQVNIPSQYRNRIKIGAVAQVFLESANQTAISAKITNINKNVSANSGTILLEMTIPVAGDILSGQIARAKLVLEPVISQSNFVKIPVEALTEISADSAKLFVFDPEKGIANEITVGFGGFIDEMALVDGLKKNTLIITAGAGFIANGQRVTAADTSISTPAGRER